MTKVSQNLHHLFPKGTTLARNSSQNGHPTFSSFWHPVSASQCPDSLYGLTGTAPSSQGYLGLRREPSVQAALAAPLLSLISR